MSDLVGNPEDRFSHNEAHFYSRKTCGMLHRYVHVMVKVVIEPHHEKTNVLVSNLVRHKPGCTATEDGQRLEISDLKSRGIILSM